MCIAHAPAQPDAVEKLQNLHGPLAAQAAGIAKGGHGQDGLPMAGVPGRQSGCPLPFLCHARRWHMVRPSGR